MSEKEVLRQIPGAKPNEPLGNSGQHKVSDPNAFGGSKRLLIGSHNDKMEQIFLALELVAELTNGSSQWIRL